MAGTEMMMGFVFLLTLLVVVVFLQRDVLAQLGAGRILQLGMIWAVIILLLVVVVRLFGFA